MVEPKSANSGDPLTICVPVSPALIHAVASAVVDQLRAHSVVGEPAPDRWMTTRQAASYVGRSVDAMHKLTAARTVPFSQYAPGGKCWFRKSDLDEWMRS